MRRHVVQAILATRHTQPQTDDIAALVADADLSILAAPIEEYDRYSLAIRAEYAQVPEDAFNARRKAFLLKMAGNPFVYSSSRGRELWEHRAQANLRRELAQLGASTAPGTPAHSPPHPIRRRRVIVYTTVVVVVAVLLVILIPFCAGPPSYYSAKYGRSDVPMHPSKKPTAFVPVKQTEPHTCGLSSVSCIYNAYGLDPAAARLRFRLGTDKELYRLLPESVGTIPPDVFRVLEQDGFDTEMVSSSNKRMAQRAISHLHTGHPALAMIRVNETWHWIVLSSESDDMLTICDPVYDEAYRKPTSKYFQDRVYCVWLIKPAE
ncbi:MAG TPA: cysteine peptidase family C39 domain-containing protein [Phycisphaerales bacterium]|nr:cysteine peptidase family C39 domain-containing protein [Phycisphaerales bacterium]